jgi:hypothetical protein
MSNQRNGAGLKEPANHVALVDRGGDTWIRVDEHPGRSGCWWPLTDGPGWELRARNGLGSPRDWRFVQEYGPFLPASRARTARALARVRAAVAR